jgi:hypothetical protein
MRDKRDTRDFFLMLFGSFELGRELFGSTLVEKFSDVVYNERPDRDPMVNFGT